jgi:dynactin-5
VVTGAQNIILGGKSVIQTGEAEPSLSALWSSLPRRSAARSDHCAGAILRGDLQRAQAGHHVVISMGRYCLVGEGTVIRPPGKMYKG